MNKKTSNPIGPYAHQAAAVRPYDPLYPEAAGYVCGMIKSKIDFAAIKHIGSTAVKGCDGKGIIDLMVIYPEGCLEQTKEALSQMGFQNQPHREPFGKERPMRVGSITYNGRLFQLHVHVINDTSPEIASTLKFRDVIAKDQNLRDLYLECKRDILKTIGADSLDYCKAKGRFIEKVLR